MMKLDGYITQIILTILLALFAWLGVQAKNLYRRYVNTDIKKAIVKDAVLFVEQVYKDIHGPDKLRAAMERASEILAEYGITISETELVTMVEAALSVSFPFIDSAKFSAMIVAVEVAAIFTRLFPINTVESAYS